MITKLYRFTIIIAVTALALGTFINAQAAPLPQTRTLLWADEFNGTSLSSAWVTCHWWSNLYCTSQPNNELQLYTAQNVLVGGGVLNLHADKLTTPINYCDRDCRDYYYTSGLIQAGGNDRGVPAGFTFTYGYAEARMKIPTGKGTFPAFWLWPANRQDPPEIDIMEVLGDAPHTTYMTYHPPAGTDSQGVWSGSTDLSQDFHVFAVDWQPNVIIWYVDGVERYRFTGATPNVPMYPIFNLAIGGNWAGAPDANTSFPSNLLVDYVRIYANDYSVGVPTSTPTSLPATATPAPTTVSPTQTPPVSPTQTPASTVKVTYDNTNPAFVYSTGWKDVLTRKALDGSYKQTSLANASVTLTFTGVGFDILYASGSGYGSFDIYLDGVKVGTLNERSSGNRYQQIWSYKNRFPQTKHELKLVALSGAQATLDGVNIFQTVP